MSFWRAFSKLPKAHNNGGLGRVREGQGEPGKARMLRRTRDSQGSPGNNREGEGQFQRFVRRLEWLPWARILSVLLWMPGTRLCTSPKAGHEAISPPSAVGHTGSRRQRPVAPAIGTASRPQREGDGPLPLASTRGTYGNAIGRIRENRPQRSHTVLGGRPCLTCSTNVPHAPHMSHSRPTRTSRAPQMGLKRSTPLHAPHMNFTCAPPCAPRAPCASCALRAPHDPCAPRAPHAPGAPRSSPEVCGKPLNAGH